MALTIDYITREITVPQADLTLVSGSLYTMNTDQFRKDVMDILAAENHIWMPDAFIHNTAVTVAGTTFARTIEFINGYNITFTPDTLWSVRLEGSNNNIFDVEGGILNQNSVQVIPTNSAGLIGSKQLEDQSFDDARVWIDVDAGQPGTAYPLGTPGTPSNNLTDAQTIISVRGLPKRIHLRGTMNVGASDVLDNYDIKGTSKTLSGLNFTSGATVAGANIADCSVTGTVTGEAFYQACELSNLSGYEGDAVECFLEGTITLAGNGEFYRCMSHVAGTGKPTLDCNSATVAIQVRSYYGGLEIVNYDQAGNTASFDGDSMRLTLASSVTAGTIVIGTCHLTDNSAGATVLTTSNDVLKVEEIHTRLGLELGNAITDTTTGIDSADGKIDINRTGDGIASSTLTRQ